MIAPKRVLALSPHTDDVELGCGGTLARWAEEGTDVAKSGPAKKEALDQPLPAVAEADADAEVITGTVAIPTRRPDHKG